MNRKNLLKVSLYSFISSAVIFVINYFFFHFVTDDGITTTWQPEPGKPFVADLIGQLGVSMLFLSIATLMIGLICYKKED
jgi:hypothetical protein